VKKCYETFPRLKQVSCYACCEDILRKTDQELFELRKTGLNLVFVGLESGDQEGLNLINIPSPLVRFPINFKHLEIPLSVSRKNPSESKSRPGFPQNKSEQNQVVEMTDMSWHPFCSPSS